ncbi:uncharacterized protein LTR77_000802 [Saxophila tyrrhenica]|uniref:Uncharacterized protein n=1 Tax=Saxophila tyrrhenica TaxID=1690608 RepID=A0AAV9PTJ1_9PEZI|nr:hypothetical protein LTR77_000802 [Saxophila tyrrhenica]
MTQHNQQHPIRPTIPIQQISHSQSTKGVDIAARRPARRKTLTKKAKEIKQAGESVRGLLLPPEKSDEEEESSPTLFRAKATTMPKNTARANAPSELSNLPRSTQRIMRFLAADKFMIYAWQVPVPKDFTNLSESRKAWKESKDEEEGELWFDDGSDDWYEHSDDGEIRPMARTFVNRAKVAFRRGMSWAEYVIEEKNAYNESIARARFPVASMAIVLDGHLRLEVFHALKKRLREEIWLEPHRDTPAVLMIPVGNPKEKVDSAMPTPVTPHGMGPRQNVAPTAKEAARGIKGWTVTADGMRQPFYEGEDEAPRSILEKVTDERAKRARRAVSPLS